MLKQVQAFVRYIWAVLIEWLDDPTRGTIVFNYSAYFRGRSRSLHLALSVLLLFYGVALTYIARLQ